MAKSKWYDEGIRFQCQGSGKCCQSRGEYGYVYLTEEDASNAAKALGIKKAEFKRKYTMRDDGILCLKEEKGATDCIFLDGHRCDIYEGRPTQCRTWPFWPEVMNAKSWNKQVVEFCPGVDQGNIHSKKEIEATLAEQKLSDKTLRKEAIT